MGQKIHPNSLRISFIQQNFVFKEKRFSFFKYTLNSYIYNSAVGSNKPYYGEKTVLYQQIKQIFDFFLSKFYCLINSFYISDRENAMLIYVEFFQYKKQENDLNLLFSCFQKHVSCVFLKKRPVIVYYKNINNITNMHEKGLDTFSKKFTNNLQGTEMFFLLSCISWTTPSANVFAKVIAILLEKNINHQAVYDFVNNVFSFIFITKPNVFKGLRFQFKGRINGVDMAKKQTITYGSVPIQTISAYINYGFAPAFTPYGTCSVKVFICYINDNAT